MRFQCRVAAVILAAFSTIGACADCTFRLEEITGSLAIPDNPRFHVGLFLQGSGAIAGFKATVAHHPKDLRFVDTDLRAGMLETAEVDADVVAITDYDRGIVTVEVTLAESVTLLPEEVRLLDLVFILSGGIPPGTVLDLTFAETPTVMVGGQEVPGSGTDGRVEIPDDNFLLLSDAWGHPGQTDIPMDLKTFNRDPLQGMQVSCRFEHDVLALQQISMLETMTEDLEAEFFEPTINNDEGYFVLGILLDSLPPPDPAKLYPVTGYPHRVARLFFEVKEDAVPVQEVPVAFQNGLGTPPINNRVVVEFQSVTPHVVDGTFTIGKVPVFLRGNANQDTRVNIADPVRILEHLFLDKPIACEKSADANDDGEVHVNDAMYILDYLFRLGPIIKPPFPEEGTDPTPDDLSCERYEPYDPWAHWHW